MHNIVAVTSRNKNVTTATRRKKRPKVKIWVIGIVDNQEPRLTATTEPELSGLKGTVLVGNATYSCVTGLCILLGACVNPKDAPEPTRACQLNNVDGIDEYGWPRAKDGSNILLSVILGELQAELRFPRAPQTI